jgi:hypothetical protein
VQRAKDVVFKTLWDKHKTYKRFASKAAMDYVRDPQNVRWLPQAIKLRVFPNDSAEADAPTEDENEGVGRDSASRLTISDVICMPGLIDLSLF